MIAVASIVAIVVVVPTNGGDAVATKSDGP